MSFGRTPSWLSKTSPTGPDLGVEIQPSGRLSRRGLLGEDVAQISDLGSRPSTRVVIRHSVFDIHSQEVLPWKPQANVPR